MVREKERRNAFLVGKELEQQLAEQLGRVHVLQERLPFAE